MISFLVAVILGGTICYVIIRFFRAMTHAANNPDYDWSKSKAQPSSPDVPIYVKVELRLNGRPDLIVKTLREVGGLLQGEVDARATHAASERCEPSSKGRAVGADEFPNIYSGILAALKKAANDAAADFSAASSPTGSLEGLRMSYAALLDKFNTMQSTLAAIDASPPYACVQKETMACIASLYRQQCTWPAQMIVLAEAATGDSQLIVLHASYDTAALNAATRETH